MGLAPAREWIQSIIVRYVCTFFFGDDRAFNERSRSVQGAFTSFERAFTSFERAFNKRSSFERAFKERSRSVQGAFTFFERAFTSFERAFNKRSEHLAFLVISSSL